MTAFFCILFFSIKMNKNGKKALVDKISIETSLLPYRL